MSDLRAKLENGGLVIETMISEIRNPNLAYMLVQSGFDFFIIDNEHGAYSPETISDMIAAARGAGIAVIGDAAGALGARYKDRPVGSFGRAVMFSFNGNKVITASGGGMLVSDDADLVDRARFLDRAGAPGQSGSE